MAKRIKTTEAVQDTALGPPPRLVKLVIKNFRCIGATPVTIDLDDIVVLVGPNNVGKSSVLKAYEVIMSEGSTAGNLSIDDFPLGKVDSNGLPEIELHTVVYDNSPGPEWIEKTDSGEMLVKELWRWPAPGAPMRRGQCTAKTVGRRRGQREGSMGSRRSCKFATSATAQGGCVCITRRTGW